MHSDGAEPSPHLEKVKKALASVSLEEVQHELDSNGMRAFEKVK